MIETQYQLKPPLKWAGGKRWLVPLLKPIWADYQDKPLIEPFVGGMAVALGLEPQKATLNDVNPHLINFYQQIKSGLNIRIAMKNQSDYFYQKRQELNQLIQKNQYQSARSASLFYYLMRTGFNGLCRFNGRGEYNVPFGQHNRIQYQSKFTAYEPLVKNWQFMNVDFAEVPKAGDEFLYADPPYDVPFTKYSQQDFNWSDQERLALWLSEHQGPVISSNQATPRIIKLYKSLKFRLFTLPAPRRIACNGDRKPALEILAIKNLSTKAIREIKNYSATLVKEVR